MGGDSETPLWLYRPVHPRLRQSRRSTGLSVAIRREPGREPHRDHLIGPGVPNPSDEAAPAGPGTADSDSGAERPRNRLLTGNTDIAKIVTVDELARIVTAIIAGAPQLEEEPRDRMFLDTIAEAIGTFHSVAIGLVTTTAEALPQRTVAARRYI